VSDQIRSFGSSPPAILSEDEILDYLAIHALYPVMSRKGKVYLRPANRKSLPNDAVGEILSRLAIHREEDCRALRRSVKERRAELRETRPIKKWVREERPRERLIQQGPASLPDSSLIAIIIGTGREGTSAEELGKRLINRLGSLRAVDSADVSDLCAIQGIGPAKAVQIKAALELGKRFCQENARRVQRIGKPDDIIEYVADYYGPYLRDAKKEVFLISSWISRTSLFAILKSAGGASAPALSILPKLSGKPPVIRLRRSFSSIIIPRARRSHRVKISG